MMRRENGLPQRIREDAAWVMSRACDVVLAEDKLPDYANLLRETGRRVDTLDAENHFVVPGDPVATAAYVVALDSINFGSGSFSLARNAGIDFGYFHLARRLKAAFDRDPSWRDPRNWAGMTATACHGIFGLPAGRQAFLDDLMRRFARHLQESAACLERDFGTIDALLSAWRGRGPEILEIVGYRWPHFQDCPRYDGRDIGVFKRAQILLADLELALRGDADSYFGGLDQLTCFADNMVPHVLRADGVLRYSPRLSGLVDAGIPLAEGAPAEVEIRCAAIVAVQKLAGLLGSEVTEVNVDHMLWHRGEDDPTRFSQFPTHICVTDCY